MLRNFGLVVLTLGVLGLLFLGYVTYLQPPTPTSGISADPGPATALPDLQSDPTRVQIGTPAGQVEVPAGGEVAFVVYDETTGRPTDRFRCDEWEPVRDSKNEVLVRKPELSMLMPSGLIATVSADQGRLTVDRVQRTQMRPRVGKLSGNALIRIERAQPAATSRATTLPDDRDAIDIRTDELQFDLELGELSTAGAIHLTSDQFEIAGSGLQLVWNQADNRVESLVVQRGEQLTLFIEGGLLSGLTGEPASQPVAAPTTKPAGAPAVAARPQRPRRMTAYECTLSDNVLAEHWRGGETMGRLSADRLALLFDTGGGDPLGASRGRRGTTQPAESRERLVVRWSGRLTLGPASTPPRAERPRRHMEASGEHVRLESPDGSIDCGRLVYEEEQQRLWLYGAADGRLHFTMGQGVTATAESLYYDGNARVVKLLGDVAIRSQRGARQGMTIRASMWAELLLTESGAATDMLTTGKWVQAGRLRAATFVGDVRISMSGQTLKAHRLEAAFRSPSGEAEQGDLAALLDRSVATGGVELRSDEQLLRCTRLETSFALDAQGEPYPKQAVAIGAVRLGQGDRRVAARGKRLVAEFGDTRQLKLATVFGSERELAVVRSQPYRVLGETIRLDPQSQVLQVEGKSTVRFLARRTLQGQERDQALPVTITSSRVLNIDGRRNLVDFSGDVLARTGTEQLMAEAMTLILEDVPTAASQPARQNTFVRMIAELQRQLLGRKGQSADSANQWAVAAPGNGPSVRKEPVRLVAQRAVVESANYEPGVKEPLVYSSIAAPELQIEVRERRIRTTGRTLLGMTSRALEQDAASDASALGLPSALMSRGPSQTALQCENSMVYVIGPEGPKRRDTVLFEGGVRFVHAAGREMVNVEQMLPQARDNPGLLDKLPSRATSLLADRLELELMGETARGGAAAGPRGDGLRLTWLNARGNVYLRDKQGPKIREVTARQLEFDRPQGLVRALGAPGDDARVYSQNTQTGQFDTPATGPAFTIDLNRNTIRAERTAGELRRP